MHNSSKDSLKRRLLSCFVVFALVGTVFIISPNNASAVMVNVTGLAEGYDQGMQIEIIADVYIEDGERIPLDHLELQIAGPMFVNTTFEVNGTPISSPPWVTVDLLSIKGQDPGYGYGYGSYDDYYDYDYGYGYGYDYDNGQTYDFGYGYGYVGRLKYKITIDSTFLLIGNYTMQLHALTGNIIHQRFSSDVRPFAIWPVGESGNSWPQFQNNPAHTGYSTSEAPDYDYLIWQKNTGWSMSSRTPVISDGKVILSGGDSNILYCFDEETGNQVWQYDAPNQVCPVPAISNNKVFFTTQWYAGAGNFSWKGSLRCLNLDNGSLIWTALNDSHEYLSSRSITISDGRIFVSDSRNLYCLNENGGLIWTWTHWDWLSGQAPLVYQGNVYVYSSMDGVFCIDLITGEEKWQNWYGDISSDLSAINNKIYFSTWVWPNNLLLSINATSGETLWTFPTQEGNNNCPPALAYGNAYLLNREYNVSVEEWHGVLYSIDQSNGTLNWKYETPWYAWYATFSCSPAVADGKVYFGDDWGRFYCVDAFNSTLLWNRDLGWDGLYTPSIANGKVFVASYNYLYCFGLDKYAPEHSNEYPSINGRTSDSTPTISVDVTDQSGVVESSIRLKVNGISVFYDKSAIADGFTISYTHIGGFSDGENVSVQIIADDIYDNVLDYTWYFIVDLTPPEILNHFPDGTGVPIETNIWVEFNELMNKNWTESAFDITPATTGTFTWGNATVDPLMIFTPDSNLAYSTTYTLNIYWYAGDIAGNQLGSTYTWNFTTEPAPDITSPYHSNEHPSINGFTNNTTPTISVWVTDISGVDQSTIRLYIDGFSVFYNLQPVTDGYNVSYYWDVGFAVGKVVPCRIIADDIYGNHLDFSWSFTVVNDTDVIYYDVSLQLGWNFISCPLALNDTTILNALDDNGGDGNTNWSHVYWYDPSDNNDHWKSYNQNWAGTQDLLNINRTMGFWINITNLGDGNLTFTGYCPTNTSIPLSPGWNLVGYPSNTIRQAQNTLPGWGTTVTKIAYYNDSAAYDIIETSDGTTMMSAGNAYWVYATATASWNINW